MTGETDLATLLRTMVPVLAPDIHVFVALPPGQSPPGGLAPRMMFAEAEGVTLILTRAQAEAAGLDFSFPCRMITLDVHSALEAVGFIALVASRLAAAGMGVNPVSGYYHDHLFVPEGRAAEAMAILDAMRAEAGGPP